MASLRSVIELAIIGSTRGLDSAAAEARRMAERIAEAEDRVSDARRRSAEAESRVADVEGRLAGARAQHTAALSQIGVAETNLQRVRDANVGAVSRLGQAEADLERLRNSGTATAEQIEQAEERIARTRTEADRANQSLQRAEAALERARGRAGQTAAQVNALEERLAAARGNAFRASEDLARAETNLNTIRRRGTDDINRQRGGLLGVFDAFSRLGQAFSGADGASTSLLAKMSALNAVFRTIGGPIVQAVAGLLEMAAVFGLIVEIVGVIGGVLGQALAGIPVLLFAIGAAAGTVALGMDGIKKAAEVMEPAFNKLKAAVSSTFEKALTPAFRELAGILPQLTPRFQGIAQALSDMAKQAIGVLTTAHGIGQLNTILAGTANFVKGLSNGISAFLLGLTDGVAAASGTFENLGRSIGNIFARLGEVFQRLGQNGTLGAAITGLASTFDGLGAVIAAVVELLIRMGAALGTSLGDALRSLGSGIQEVIPFFEDLARVAGEILVAAVEQLGPPLSELVQSILPGASAGLEGFKDTIINVVLPAIADFIDWLRTDGIPGFLSFVAGMTAGALSMVSTFIGVAQTILGVFQGLFTALALIPGPFQQQFAEGAAVIGAYKDQLGLTRAEVDKLKDKTVKVQFQTQGAEIVKGVKATLDTVRDKTVKVISNVFGQPETEKLKSAIDDVPANKTSTTTSTVTGEQANRTLTDAINLVQSKTTQTLSNVFGEPQNKSLKSAIDAVPNKEVTVRANVEGESAVRSLVNAIAQVHDKTVTVISNVINNVSKAFATGGRVPATGSFLVGENGPELLTLDGLGGVITPPNATKRALDKKRVSGGATPVGGDSGGGDGGPITVNVLLSQERFAELARVEIDRQNRATKRTVLAGSGVTF